MNESNLDARGATAQSAREQSIAVLGTGTMGEPIARNLIAAGFHVIVWNRTSARAEAVARRGARLASSPAEAAALSDVILTMLADGAAVESAMSGPGGALRMARRGAVWIQMATVGTEWTRRLAGVAAEAGVEFVDAPVSGSDGPAREGMLVVLASGPDSVRERVAPVFDAIGRETLWLGRAGNGSKLKLALNNWLATQVEAAAETIALTEAMGLDPHLVARTIADGPLGSPYALLKSTAMIERRFEPGFALRHAFKDALLALAAARDEGIELPLTDALACRWNDAIAAGHADDDVASVIAVALTDRLAKGMDHAYH
jgi:3-hydroxyisobutyrate dehydrogenase